MKNILWFRELICKCCRSGWKGASLGEMEQKGFPVPTGFVVTSGAYFTFMKESGIQDKVVKMIDEIDVESTQQLEETTARVRKIIENTPIIPKLNQKLPITINSSPQNEDALVAVRVVQLQKIYQKPPSQDNKKHT